MFIFTMRSAIPKFQSQSYFHRVICSWNGRKSHILSSHDSSLSLVRQFALKSLQLEAEYKTELNNMNTMYPEFKRLMISKIPSVKVQERLAQILDYNVIREDNSHLLLFLKLSEDLRGESKKQILNRAQIYNMAWILETLTMAGILMDDVADDSKYRSGKLCWHRLENNASIIQNDIFMLYTTTNAILWEQFGKMKTYDQIFALLSKLYITASTAEILNHLTKKSKHNIDLEEYYNTVAKWKGSLGFEMQIKIALFMNGYEQISFTNLLDRICHNLGYYQSLLNDYFDINGDPYEIGKKYENIKEGDITWFFKEAKKVLPTSGQKILTECYGSKEEDCTEKILRIYEEANLMEQFDEHEEQLRKSLMEDIDKLPIETLRHHLQHVMYGFEKLKTNDLNMRHNFVWILF